MFSFKFTFRLTLKKFAWLEVFCEVVCYFVLDMYYNPKFCSNIA